MNRVTRPVTTQIERLLLTAFEVDPFRRTDLQSEIECDLASIER